MAALTAILLTAAALARAEVLLDAKEESLFTLSPSVDVIAFSNYTTNNPLDNLKDFHDTWSPGFDVHEFQVEEGEVRDQLAVETRHHPPTMQVNTNLVIVTFTTTGRPNKWHHHYHQNDYKDQTQSSLLRFELSALIYGQRNAFLFSFKEGTILSIFNACGLLIKFRLKASMFFKFKLSKWWFSSSHFKCSCFKFRHFLSCSKEQNFCSLSKEGHS